MWDHRNFFPTLHNLVVDFFIVIMPRGHLAPIHLASHAGSQGPSMNSSLTLTAEELGTKTLLGMFPGMDALVVAEVLRVVNGDLTKAAEYLAEMVPAHEVVEGATGSTGKTAAPMVIAPNEDSNFPSLVSTVPEAWDVILKDNGSQNVSSKGDSKANCDDEFVLVDSLETDDWCVVDEGKKSVAAPAALSYASCIKPKA